MHKLYPIIFRISKRKFEKYDYLHIVGGSPNLKIKNQILHLDDPNYLAKEINFLNKWENNLLSKQLVPIVICTNKNTEEYLKKITKKSKIIIIEQGFDSVKVNEDSKSIKKYLDFSCAYSSPYIHIGSDKHSGHDTWGAELLINQIVPAIYHIDPQIKIHLIGELGKNASSALSKYNNIVYHGRVNFSENMEILSKCTIGIYPRNKDLKRSMSKIFSYIGAGLPIVTYDLYDTEIVKRNKLGFSVNTVEEFVQSIKYLKNNPKEIKRISGRVNVVKSEFTWQNLSKKMEKLLLDY
jgi:glycosyltransferase involved in cell wall biosynthesis